MDAELIELELKDKSTFAALSAGGDPEEEVSLRSMRISLASVSEQLGKVAEELVEHARKAAPTEIEVTLRVGFSVSSGTAIAVLVDGAVEGGLEVKMTWKDIPSVG